VSGRRASLERVLAAGLAAACLFPFLYLGLLSVAGAWGFPHLLPETLRTDRWRSVLGGGGGLLASLGLSLAVAASVGVVSTLLGFVTARGVAYHPHRDRLLLLAYVPYALSPVVSGACLLFVFIKLGLAASFAGLVLAHTIFAYAFSVVFWAAFWNREMLALEELVRTLGGTTADVYRRVFLPLSKGPLAICFFQAFLISWFQYGLTILVGAGKFQTLPLRVYAYLGEGNPGFAAAAAVLLVLPPALLLWVNRRMVFRVV
jgi:putative spermidine/putrescine transport system permease protein